jgi:hypothetical protein
MEYLAIVCPCERRIADDLNLSCRDFGKTAERMGFKKSLQTVFALL